MINKLLPPINRKTQEELKLSKIQKQKEIIYQLKIENQKIKEQNEVLKGRLYDVSEALKSNKELLLEMSDKFNAQLALNHKNLSKKTEQLKEITKEKDDIIQKLRSNFALHMEALKFTCRICGSSQFKTEVWKDCLDKTRLMSDTNIKDSEGQGTTDWGSKTLQNHIDSFCEWIGSARKEHPPEEDPDTSLKTFRVVINDNVPDKSQLDWLDKSANDLSVIVHNWSPAKLQFHAGDEDDADKGMCYFSTNYILVKYIYDYIYRWTRHFSAKFWTVFS